MRYLQYTLFLASILGASLSFADRSLIPANRKELNYSFKSNLLTLHLENTTKPKLYLIYNKKMERLLLSHPDRRRITNAGWDSMLKSGNWSAFIVNRPNFVISCRPLQKNFQAKPVISCSRVLTVCVYRHIKINDPAMKGTFWVAEDQSLETILERIKARFTK